METDKLKYFCAIVDAGSLTKAAEVLGVSHSGLSKAMSVLQDELGFKLLSPRGRGLEITEKGKSLYKQSRQILEIVNSLKTQMPINTSFLKIGLPEVLALVASESIARELRSALTIEELDSGEIESKVLDRSFDFAFTFIPFPHKELDHLKITTVTLASFCRANCFQQQDPEVIPYVVPSSEMKDNPLSMRIRDGWNSNLSRFTPYRANSLSIALNMVRSGSCAIYTPSFVITYLNESESRERKFIELDLPAQRKAHEKTKRDIFLVKRSNDDESKAMKTVVKIIKQICKERPG
ncbi:MAG: LysR family transcriptional regulator [Bdellovibrionaceae bacterium]|nr:LysR family transcriptional regulator [Pseudobdellovibrionaceae bacterium]